MIFSPYLKLRIADIWKIVASVVGAGVLVDVALYFAGPQAWSNPIPQAVFWAKLPLSAAIAAWISRSGIVGAFVVGTVVVTLEFMISAVLGLVIAYVGDEPRAREGPLIVPMVMLLMLASAVGPALGGVGGVVGAGLRKFALRS